MKLKQVAVDVVARDSPHSPSSCYFFTFYVRRGQGQLELSQGSSVLATHRNPLTNF